MRQHEDQEDTNDHFCDNVLARFDKMVVKVTETKTVADSLWQGYNVRTTLSISQNVSQFSETSIRVTT